MNTGMSEELSITEGNHALQNFTDRDAFIRRFAEYLNDEQPREKILFFQGEGGKGKSLLLRFLQKTCCKRFSPEKWENLKNMQPKEFAGKMKNDSVRQNDYTAIPASLLDFGQQPRGEDQPQDPFYGLLMLRRNIGAEASRLKYRLRFPLYDFACFWYLHKKGKSSKEIRKLFPPEEMELLSVLVDAFISDDGGTVMNITRTLLNTVGKPLGDQIILCWRKRGLDE